MKAIAWIAGWGVMGLMAPATALWGQGWLDQAEDALTVPFGEGRGRLHAGVQFDLEGYLHDDPPPGLLFEEDGIVQPRLTLTAELEWGRQWRVFTQFRADRGFDPGLEPDGDARFDEYFARWTPLEEGGLALQGGKFATVFGGWVGRHDAWNNPLITAPAPYEQMLTITDPAAPPGPAAFLARRSAAPVKDRWLPLIWGPSYATGISASGTLGEWTYAAEVKNAGISSRPYAWDAFDHDFSHPTVTVRAGWRPTAAWSFGVSGSRGAYLLPEADPTLPLGTGVGDFLQTTLGADLSWARRRWQVWAEAMIARFEVPHVGDADLIAGFVEAKYKVTAQLFVAARFNALGFGEIPDGAGGREAWDNGSWRLDGAVGYRFHRHAQAKLQYSYGDEQDPGIEGNHLLAAQFTVRF